MTAKGLQKNNTFFVALLSENVCNKRIWEHWEMLCFIQKHCPE